MSQQSTDQLEKTIQDLNKQGQNTTKTAQVATEVLLYWKEVERKQSELRQNLSDIVELEREIEALKVSARVTNHPPGLSDHLIRLASAKGYILNYLKEHDLGISLETIIDECKNPKKWWQFWRSRAAAELVHPSVMVSCKSQDLI